MGERRNFQGGIEWLRSLGIRVMDLDSEECVAMMAGYIREHPEYGMKTSDKGDLFNFC